MENSVECPRWVKCRHAAHLKTTRMMDLFRELPSEVRPVAITDHLIVAYSPALVVKVARGTSNK
jgi:hypothetical protein